MKRLSVRLLASHALVACVGALTTFVVVRLLAPALFDESLRRELRQGLGPVQGQGLGQGQGLCPGQGLGQGQGVGAHLRVLFASAVDQATLLGALIGLAAAIVISAFVAHRVLGSLRAIAIGTRRIAAGDYADPVPLPPETELARLAADVNLLGAGLRDTEATRVRLLGDVAHEMRTPLTVVDGYLTGMLDGLLPPSHENLTLLRAETGRLTRLADDLSALSRGAEGVVTLSRCTQPVRPVVLAAAERCVRWRGRPGSSCGWSATGRR